MAEQERTIADIEDRNQRLMQELHVEQGSLRDTQERAQKTHEEASSRIEQLMAENQSYSLKLDETIHELEQQRSLYNEERSRAQQHEEEMGIQLEQLRQENQNVASELDQTSQLLEQQKILLEDERERGRIKVDDLQQQIEQLQQERDVVLARLEQQKKFCEEEREQRRQREIELLQQKKSLQDATGSLRQKDQQLSQQKKLYDDESARWKTKEQMLTRRVEQLQQDWRSMSTKLEQTQRELMMQKKTFPTDFRTATPARPDARKSIFNEQVEDKKPFSPPPAREVEVKSQLVSIEKEAQREIQVWKEKNEPKDEKPGKPAEEIQKNQNPSDEPPKSLFKHRPWIRLK